MAGMQAEKVSPLPSFALSPKVFRSGAPSQLSGWESRRRESVAFFMIGAIVSTNGSNGAQIVGMKISKAVIALFAESRFWIPPVCGIRRAELRRFAPSNDLCGVARSTY
jgi:hypothetical protein